MSADREVAYTRWAIAGVSWEDCAHSEFMQDDDPRWPEIDGFKVMTCHGCGGPVLERIEVLG